MAENWYVYLLRCADHSLYCGVTTDTSRRVDEHNQSNKLGAKYTRVRRPVELAFVEVCKSRSQACQREHQIKRLSKEKKELLVITYQATNS
ncbi:GIY-YIG nuclease family protein [Thalassotalea atypica]|uniref:GIY-YIG nuclease family protein n=1 Tax=Thalassotalea atypica TaxID=2054316 RepID=UPI0025738F6A|nr:GIY-YIG nuclease family protein [Thalassotalea atypica]